MFQIDIEALQIKSSKNEWHMCIVWLENSKSNVGNSDDHSRSKFVFCRKRVSFFHVLFCDAQVWSNCIRFYHFWNEIFLNHFKMAFWVWVSTFCLSSESNLWSVYKLGSRVWALRHWPRFQSLRLPIRTMLFWSLFTNFNAFSWRI